MELAALGWTEGRAAELAALGDPTLVPGRVSLEHNHVYRLLTAEGEHLAEAAGRIKYLASGRSELPAVGDWVAARLDPAGGRSVIRGILPRHTWFSRKAAGRETEEQVLAANVDTVLIVFGLDKLVNERSIERYLVVARRSHAEPVIVLNKADVSDDLAGDVAEATAAAGGVPVISLSARDEASLGRLEPYLRTGRTIAMLGPSGVGKSTIVNRLVGRELLATGEVRDWDGRGRHTSVHRQLVVREAGGLIIDTPGMRELQLWETDSVVGDTFSDISELGAGCRFRDCLHNREPGCAVKAAVEAGTLDGGRYESYLKLQAEEAATRKLRDEKALLENKRQTRIQQRALRALQNQRHKR